MSQHENPLKRPSYSFAVIRMTRNMLLISDIAMLDRFRTLELVAQKILDPADAAAFLVALEKIQHGLHRFAAEQESRKGTVTVSTRGLRSISERESGSESPHRSVRSIDKRLLKNARRDCKGRYQTHDDGTALARFIEELQGELQEHCTQIRKDVA